MGILNIGKARSIRQMRDDLAFFIQDKPFRIVLAFIWTSIWASDVEVSMSRNTAQSVSNLHEMDELWLFLLFCIRKLFDLGLELVIGIDDVSL